MTERAKKHHPTGSLARRVLLVCLLILVIPLFLQNVITYIQDYKQELIKAEQVLTVLAEERAGLIDHVIEMYWEILDTVSGDIQEHAKQWNIQEIPAPANAEDHFVAASKKQNAILAGKRNPNGTAYAIAIPFKTVIAELVAQKDSPYPIRMAIIDPKGKVWAENMSVRGDQTDLLVVEEPIQDTQWKLILTIPKNTIRELQVKIYIYEIATLIILIGVIGGGAVVWMTRRIAKPLKQLCDTMERVSKGGIHARYIPDRMGFEINELGKQFNETLDAMLLHQQEAAVERLARERLAEELKIGHDIQMNLLPSSLPEFPGLDIASGYLPAKEVSGDYFDLFPLKSGKLLITMADTVGKGISACLFSLGMRSIIRALARTTENLSEIVLKANDLFWLDAHNTGVFITLWLAIYDPEKKTLTYCSQGHPPALLRRNNHVKDLWTEGIAMGAQQIDIVPISTETLLPGDVLLVYTDGIIEAHDTENQLYGKKRLHEFLLQSQKESSQQVVDGLIEEVGRFSQGTSQHDDITLLTLTVLN